MALNPGLPVRGWMCFTQGHSSWVKLCGPVRGTQYCWSGKVFKVYGWFSPEALVGEALGRDAWGLAGNPRAPHSLYEALGYNDSYQFCASCCGNVLLILLSSAICRSTAFGIQSVFGRIGSILGNLSFGKLITVDPFIPILLVAALLIFGGLVGFLLPNPRGESSRKRLSKCTRLCCCKHCLSPCCHGSRTARTTDSIQDQWSSISLIIIL